MGSDCKSKQKQFEILKRMTEEMRKSSEVDLRDENIPGAKFDKDNFIQVVSELSQISQIQSLLAISSQWVIITLAAIFAIHNGSWLSYLLSAIVMATRQHALGIIVHDASHYRLFKSRKYNDLISNLFVAFPLGMSTTLYRKWHFPHHRYTNTERDPEWLGSELGPEWWAWPKEGKDLLRLCLMDLVGLNSIKLLFLILTMWSPWVRLFISSKKPAGISMQEKVSLIIFGLFCGSALTYFNMWIPFLLLWIVPMFTLLISIFRFRSVAEHKVVPNHSELSEARSIEPSFIERLLISPLNVNFHLEHHLFPSVPFFNLKKLHKLLLLDPVFQNEAHVNYSYLSGTKGVLTELINSENKLDKKI